MAHLKGKTSLVTGASRGIGRATAHSLLPTRVHALSFTTVVLPQKPLQSSKRSARQAATRIQCKRIYRFPKVPQR